MTAPRSLLLAAALVVLSAACSDAPAAQPAPTPTPTPAPDPTPTQAPEPAPEPTAVPYSSDELIAATAVALPRWADVAVAEADGYRSIGDGFTGYEHFVNPVYMLNGEILEPERPESLVYRVTPQGRELVSAMYLLPFGSTMDDVPDLGDPRAVWHTHDDLCFDADGRLAGQLVDGACRPGGSHLQSPPMLHVWIVEHPCGPFAGLEGHGDACPHDDH